MIEKNSQRLGNSPLWVGCRFQKNSICGLLKKTFYGCCQVLFFFFSRRLAHSLSGDVGQVVVFIIRFVVFPEDKNNFQPLSSQSSNRSVVGMSLRALLTIVCLRPFALVKRSKSQPVDSVLQALIPAKAKMYYPNFSALFSQWRRSCLSLKMPEGLPPSWSIAYLRPHTRQCRTTFGPRQAAHQLSRRHGGEKTLD